MDEDIKSLTDGITNITSRIEALKSEMAAKGEVSAVQAEMKSLADKQTELARELTELRQAQDAAPAADEGAKSIGQQVIESKGFKDFAQTRRMTLEVKTPLTTQASNTVSRGTIGAPYQAGFVSNPEEDLVVEALFPHVPINTQSLQYVKEGTFTNNAALVAENSQKPESSISFSLQTANVVTLAHILKVTKQVYDDNPQSIMALIDHKMRYGLQQVVDRQLIQGQGGSTQLPGALLSGNYTDYSTAAGVLSTDSLFDFIFKHYTALATAAVNANRLVLNPADWAELALLKDKQGRYLLGGPGAVAGKVVWGIPVLTTSSMPQGKFLLGDFNQAATIYERQALQVALSDEDDKNFQYNLITIRVERRLAVTFEQPLALDGGDFGLSGSSSGS